MHVDELVLPEKMPNEKQPQVDVGPDEVKAAEKSNVDQAEAEAEAKAKADAEANAEADAKATVKKSRSRHHRPRSLEQVAFDFLEKRRPSKPRFRGHKCEICDCFIANGNMEQHRAGRKHKDIVAFFEQFRGGINRHFKKPKHQ